MNELGEGPVEGLVRLCLLNTPEFHGHSQLQPPSIYITVFPAWYDYTEPTTILTYWYCSHFTDMEIWDSDIICPGSQWTRGTCGLAGVQPLTHTQPSGDANQLFGDFPWPPLTSGLPKLCISELFRRKITLHAKESKHMGRTGVTRSI